MVQRFASNVYERILKRAHKRRLEYVTDAIAFPVRHRQRNQQSFCQEAIMWKYLTHPNIVPLLGVSTTPFQLISNWMSCGDLPGYIKKNPDADRLKLVGVPLSCLSCAYSYCQLSDVAKGLHYLHSCNVIHGDLKGVCSRSNFSLTTTLTHVQPNILMDDSGNARIVDFGFTTVTLNLDSVRSVQCQRGFTPRWTAPEVLEEGPLSKEADIFSFAMVMIEVVIYNRPRAELWPNVVSY